MSIRTQISQTTLTLLQIIAHYIISHCKITLCKRLLRWYHQVFLDRLWAYDGYADFLIQTVIVVPDGKRKRKWSMWKYNIA